MLEQFTNLYSICKTLCFMLLPVGKTEENFNAKNLLEQDKQRAENYVKVKGYIDECHKVYIEKRLSEVAQLDEIREYAELYYKSGKTDKEKSEMEKLEQKMRTRIVSILKKNKTEYGKLFKKEMIREILPEFLEKQEEKEIVKQFYDFSTYFTGFFTNRENMYTDEAQPTGIAFRCINENLPRFLDNAKSFIKIKQLLPSCRIDSLNLDFSGLYGVCAEDIFSVDYFAFVLSQSGIDKYNQIIGGYTNTDGTKIQGLNEYINLYNQQTAKDDKSLRLPILKSLYKQILSDKETVSFIPEAFENDDAVLDGIKEFYEKCIESCLNKISLLFTNIGNYSENGIFVKNGLAITDLSNAVFDSWSVIQDGWNEEYEQAHPKKNKTEKYYEARKKAFKANKSFSIADLQKYGENSITGYYKEKVCSLCENIKAAYREACQLVSSPYACQKRLAANADAVEKIKNLLDAIKELEKLMKPLLGCSTEENKDNDFYGEFLPLFDSVSNIDKLYDKVRNYMTQKPYSTEKILLNFNKKALLNGWVDSITDSSDNGTQYGGYLFRKRNSIGEYDYFVGISGNTKLFRFFKTVDNDDKSEYERLDYYQPKTETIYGSAYKGQNSYAVDKQYLIKYIFDFSCQNFSEELTKTLKDYISIEKSTASGCISIIKKDSVDNLKLLCNDETFQALNHGIIENLKKTILSLKRLTGTEKIIEKDYSLFTEIINDIDSLSKNKIFRFFHVSDKEFKTAIESDVKPLYLFKITNKDLEYAEKYSAGLRQNKGTDNLHTLYFKSLMSGEQSTFDIGSASIFFRPKSIAYDDDIMTYGHHRKELTGKFTYPIIKDRRYTCDTILFHLAIQLNYKADKPNTVALNDRVRNALKEKGSNYVIGIDRGERNLIYICVIDGSGKIVEQCSLNEIIGDNGYKVDYHKLLGKREDEMKEARKSWSSIGSIKELKEGYISQVVHKICELVIKYDAIIAVEDLNGGFMNKRAKVDKQVYRKFEKMLTDKLNFLADKKTDPEEYGGILNAYQLTAPYEPKSRSLQNGIIFYVPAWLTSKIDPVTGFAALVKAKYTGIDASRAFFEKFTDIRFNAETDMFEFDTDYTNFDRCDADFRKKWVICTNGERIRSFQNPEKNSKGDNETVYLTPEFKRLFDESGIDYGSALQQQICARTEEEFFEKLTELFNLTVQMRNSITNTDVDYLISPVRNSDGVFYDSRDYSSDGILPADADANGAYNIARKALWTITNIGEDNKAKRITNAEWLEFAQNE